MINNNKKGIGRPRMCRKIKFSHKTNFFKPQGVPMRELKTISLTIEELEAMRLKNVENKNQTECAEIMKTSQSTFQRILSEAYKKVSKALVTGMAIEILE